MNDTQTVERSEGRFISTDQNLRLVQIPGRNVLNPATGVLEPVPGKAIEFRNGLVDADSEDAAWLREHDEFNVLFFEQGNEPRRPDDPSVVLEAIVDATAAGNADELETLYVEERASLSRPEVLRAAARGLERVAGEDAVPAPPATPVHQLERVRDASIETHPGGDGVGRVAEGANEGGAVDTGEGVVDGGGPEPTTDEGESSRGIVDPDAPTPQEGTEGESPS